MFTRLRHSCALKFLPLAAVSLLPVFTASELWLSILRGGRPRCWDGSGHYALAAIYDRSIFPETFGWVQNYFAGMPFPNFYPPLFYWCVALLHHSGMFSFDGAFYAVLVTPVFLLPAAIWFLAWKVTARDYAVATASAFACLPLLVDNNSLVGLPAGLDYMSTFRTGLYSQPLGFILLIAWLLAYLEDSRRRSVFALTSLLLALTVLANFFNAIIAGCFVCAIAAGDLLKWLRAGSECAQARARFVRRLLSALIAAALTLFWVGPMLFEYKYFVTRPVTSPLRNAIPLTICLWYALAAFGAAVWLRRRAPGQTTSFLTCCSALAFGIVISTTITPRWFPLQTLRFLATLNFLLALPAGQGVLTILRSAASGLLKLARYFRGGSEVARLDSAARFATHSPAALSLALSLLLGPFLVANVANFSQNFYPPNGDKDVESVLSFARSHTDGRYLVEVPFRSYPAASVDSRSISSYLGAQGNDSLSVVFREAAPNSLFFNPQADAFSALPNTFGVSSMLADSVDFVEQPLASHIDRASSIGTKYLVISSPWMVERLSKETAAGERHDFGRWSVFELPAPAAPPASVLPYRPALVVSDVTLKLRRRNEYNFVRLAEEQYADGWFDVMLVNSPERKVEKIKELDDFGALILDRYEYDDEDVAFARLRDFARRRTLVLLSSGSALFRRIEKNIGEFPHAVVVNRLQGQEGEWMGSEFPSENYKKLPIHQEWLQIKDALDKGKVPTEPAQARLDSAFSQNDIRLDPSTLSGIVPVLMRTSYHPNWFRDDGREVYAATPFFTLTFIDRPTRIHYSRHWYEWLALLATALALLTLVVHVINPLARRYTLDVTGGTVPHEAKSLSP
jgi:hypothetical protein